MNRDAEAGMKGQRTLNIGASSTVNVEARLAEAEEIADRLPNPFSTLADTLLVRCLQRVDGGGADGLLDIMAETVRTRLFPDIALTWPPEHPSWRQAHRRLVDMLYRLAVLEYGWRLAVTESPEGRAVHDCLVTPDAREWKELVRLATRRLRYHPEFSADQAPKEIASLANDALAIRLAPYRNCANPFEKRNMAALQGLLNRIPDNARHAVKEKLKTAKRMMRLRSYPPLRTGDNIEDNEDATEDYFDSFPAEDKDGVERRLQQRVLIEWCRRHPALTRRERVVFEMTLREETQSKVAEALGVSQQAVSKCVSSIKRKLRQSV